MSGTDSRDEEVIDSGEASAGDAEELDPETAASRADDVGLESKAALDERQERLRTTRRWGGPDLDAESEARDEEVEEGPEVEPTAPEEADSGAT